MSSSTARKLSFYDNPRFEKLDGKFYAMAAASINHCQVSGNIYHMLRHYLAGRRCRPFQEADVFLDDDNVIPDVMIVCDRDKIKPNGVYGAPDLIVEILSPTTIKRDKVQKMQLYERFAIKEYWLVDPASKTLELYVYNERCFELPQVYTIVPDEFLDKFPEDYREKPDDTFFSPTFPDMEVRLEEVFLNVE